MTSHRCMTAISRTTEHVGGSTGKEGWRVTPRGSGRFYPDGGTCKLECGPHLFLTLRNPWRPPHGSPTSSDRQGTWAPAKHGAASSLRAPPPLISKTMARLTKRFALASSPQCDGPRTQAGPGRGVPFVEGKNGGLGGEVTCLGSHSTSVADLRLGS